MALKVNLLLNKTYFLPGEVVQVSVQMSNEPQASQPLLPMHIKELSFQAQGTERTNPNFIQRLWRPDNGSEVADGSKQVRTIFSTEPAVLVSDQPLHSHGIRSFQLRFRLPASLPPSFRGSSVRFLYLIQVKAVYEVHRGNAAEAVVYETTASTALMVWPPQNLQPLVERMPSVPEASGAAAAGMLPRELSRSSSQFSTAFSTGLLPNGSVSGPGQGLGLTSSGGGAPPVQAPPLQPPLMAPPSPSASSVPTPANTTPQASTSGAAAAAEDDVGMSDYSLGRNNCRIRWREVSPEPPQRVGPHPGHDGSPGPPGASPGGPLAHSHAGPRLHHHGTVIPFGINKPSMPHSASQAAVGLPDSDEEGGAADKGGPEAGLHRTSGSMSHLQRQISGGGGGGIGPFSRGVSRKGSMFGKQYALNLEEHPLLKLMMQAPLDLPLQPGATFGGVLDFRPPPGGARQRQCHSVVVLLESEELVAPEYRAGAQASGSSSGSSPPAHTIRKLHAEHHEVVTDVCLTSFTFSVPASATPSFRTPMVALRWVLRFELQVGPRLDFAAMDKRARAPRVTMEQLVWCLPLVVRPPMALR